MADRTVHAETPTAAVVRYDRRGTWHIEDKTALRQFWGKRLNLRDVVEWVTEQEQTEVTYYFGVPGGLQFDKRVKAELERVFGAKS